VHSLVAGDMSGPADDINVLNFLYHFVDQYRLSKDLYDSATVIFEKPLDLDEEQFDALLWQRLQSISNLDAVNYSYDNRVSNDPHSPHFSFSLKGEAFFIIGLHPGSSRPTRRFSYPALVFNPHEQFELLRQQNHYEAMKDVVRKRDIQYSGSVNPMLDDFGSSSEALQYSGRMYDKNWKCPFQFNNENK
jgi:FPC/CPF motif-containing protein YcgG